MASIHKDPRNKSPFWYCAFTMPDGARVFKSTKEKDKSRAMSFCLALEETSKKAHAGDLTPAGAKEAAEAVSKRAKGGGATPNHAKGSRRVESQANKLFGEILEVATGETLITPSLRQFCGEWLASKGTRKANATWVRYKNVVDQFLAFVGTRKAAATLTAIAPRDVRAFHDSQVTQGKSETTANLFLKVLRGIFNDARRQGMIASNPAEAVETLDAQQESRDAFTVEQIRELVKAAPAEWKTMVLLGYHTGARLSDCVNMAWSNVDLEKKVLSFSPRKTSRGKARSEQLKVPIMAGLEEHLLSLPTCDDPTAKLCPTLSRTRVGGKSGLSSRFTRVMKKAGITSEVGATKIGKGRQFRTLGFHSLRHSFVSELANADVPAEVRKQISGHNSDNMHARYTHLDDETQRRAMEKMPPVI